MSGRAIHVTPSELDRLRRAVESAQPDAADRPHVALLRDALALAARVWPDALPTEVVTMHSRVHLRDGARTRTVAVVFPEEAEAESGRISVLAPLGAALLGRRVGDRVVFSVAGGERECDVLGVEPATQRGDFDMNHTDDAIRVPVGDAPPRDGAAAAPSDPDRLIINRRDLERLGPYCGSHEQAEGVAEYLRQALSSAMTIAPQGVPPNVVTMNSRVRIRSTADGESDLCVLCYPGEEDAEEDGVRRLSVLSPLGAALLGVVEGSTVRVIGPRRRTFVVEAIEYQPERAGVFAE